MFLLDIIKHKNEYPIEDTEGSSGNSTTKKSDFWVKLELQPTARNNTLLCAIIVQKEVIPHLELKHYSQTLMVNISVAIKDKRQSEYDTQYVFVRLQCFYK